jgi:hypothetical protein
MRRGKAVSDRHENSKTRVRARVRAWRVRREIRQKRTVMGGNAGTMLGIAVGAVLTSGEARVGV